MLFVFMRRPQRRHRTRMLRAAYHSQCLAPCAMPDVACAYTCACAGAHNEGVARIVLNGLRGAAKG